MPTDLAVNPLAPSRIDRPLYRIPAFSLVSRGIGGIALGVAQAALDAVIELAQTKATDAGLLADRSHAEDDRSALRAARTPVPGFSRWSDPSGRQGAPSSSSAQLLASWREV